MHHESMPFLDPPAWHARIMRAPLLCFACGPQPHLRHMPQHSPLACDAAMHPQIPLNNTCATGRLERPWAAACGCAWPPRACHSLLLCIWRPGGWEIKVVYMGPAYLEHLDPGTPRPSTLAPQATHLAYLAYLALCLPFAGVGLGRGAVVCVGSQAWHGPLAGLLFHGPPCA